MEYIPVRTRVINPPQDDLFAVLDLYLSEVKERDVVAISSKVMSIHEGNCVPVKGTDKKQLVAENADVSIPRDYWGSPLTIIKNAFIGTAGIDESNADGYFVLLPEDPFLSAKNIHTYLKDRFSLKNVGVIITDSHSIPMRRGAVGISIGFWGFKPTINCVGKKDLFGREMEIEVANLVDGLAAGANVVMGEVSERQPAVIIRDVPELTFTEEKLKDEAYVPFHKDTFRVLYERWIEK